MNLNKLSVGSVLVAALSWLGLTPAWADYDYDDEAEYRNSDPWEPVNRAVFRFNDTLDTYTLRPVARTYDRLMPKPLNDGVSNVFNNLGEPKNLVNNLLQGKFHDAGVDTARFLLNTTLGVVGVFDVATRMGLQRNDEDFGQTLGVWGVNSGPYVMLPFLGPSTLRDAPARGVEAYSGYNYYNHLDHIRTRNSTMATEMVDTRAALLGQERLIRGDRYTFIRNAYLQNREFKVRDGMVDDDF